MSAPRGAVAVVEITADTVRRGDVLRIGGRAFQVCDLTALHGGAKRLTFVGGESLTLLRGSALTAERAVPPGPRPSSFWRDR